MPTKLIGNKVKPVQSKNSWKQVQSKTKKIKRNKLALVVLAAVFGLLILSWLVNFTKNLFNPWQASPSTKNYMWNKTFNINLLFRGSGETSLISYNPKEEKIVIIKIPEDVFLDVPYSFGKWQIRAVYGLGESQKGLGGDRLLKDSIESFLGIPIDGFLDLSKLKQQSADSLIDSLRSNPFSGFNFLSDLKTDLTLWELINFKFGVSNVRFDKIEHLDLGELDVLDKENLPDSTIVFTGDPNKLDPVMLKLADPTIISEHKTIAVFNATEKPLLAQNVARLISNLGGNVIYTANSKKVFDKTQVVGEESLTLKRLVQIFTLGCQNKLKCDNISFPGEVESSRAQINVFLGEDYLK